MNGQLQTHDQLSYAPQQQENWDTNNQLQDQPLELAPELHPFGLEALSTAALYRPPQAKMVSHSRPNNRPGTNSPLLSSPTNSEHRGPSISPSAVMSSSNNLNFLLNPASAMNSPIDPSLMSPEANQTFPTSNAKPKSQSGRQSKRSDGEAESEQKVAFILRHFSESPGQW